MGMRWPRRTRSLRWLTPPWASCSPACSLAAARCAGPARGLLPLTGYYYYYYYYYYDYYDDDDDDYYYYYYYYYYYPLPGPALEDARTRDPVTLSARTCPLRTRSCVFVTRY